MVEGPQKLRTTHVVWRIEKACQKAFNEDKLLQSAVTEPPESPDFYLAKMTCKARFCDRTLPSVTEDASRRHLDTHKIALSCVGV